MKRTREEIEDELNKAFDDIKKGIDDYFKSDTFSNYLDFISKFNGYSYRNNILISQQYPHATAVAGYKRWKDEFNRQVKKGEKEISILAPSSYKRKISAYKKDKNGDFVLDEKGEKIKEEVEKNFVSFRIVKAFDVSQTEGDPVPTLTNKLVGNSKEAEAFTKALKEYSPVPIIQATEIEDPYLKTANGYYDLKNKFIVVNKNLSGMQKAKIMIHEIAHSRLHNSGIKDKKRAEIEAESVAYVVCKHFNIDSSSYSFGYIANYARDLTTEQKGEILDNITKDTYNIIQVLEPLYQRKLEKQIKEVKNHEIYL